MLTRWRHSRGYGVHSPLAFRLVKEVLRPSREVIYYGEERLMLSSLSGAELRRARLLLRFVAHISPTFVWTSAGLPEFLLEGIRQEGGVVRIFDGKAFPHSFDDAGLFVLHGSTLRTADLKRALAPGKAFIGFNLSPAFMRRVVAAMPGGVALEGVESIMAVPASGSPLHHYLVSGF